MSLEKLEKLQSARGIEVKFDLGGLPCLLRDVDALEMREEISIVRVALRERYLKEKLDKVPIDETEWNAYIRNRRKALEDRYADEENVREIVDQKIAEEIENKPETEMERLIGQNAIMRTIYEVVPRFIIDAETGQRLVDRDEKGNPIPEQLKRLKDIIRGDVNMSNAVTVAYTDLISKSQQFQDTVKNL